MMEEKKQLYCSVRKTWVSATPEEHIRQNILQLLIQSLGFPTAYISVEKEIKSLLHIQRSEQLSERRVDIICFTKSETSGLYPFLLIECKAVPITSKELRQVIGYNHHLKAPFIALANQFEKKLGWYDSQIADYTFVDYIPTYTELYSSIST
jgi:hypothetical protein